MTRRTPGFARALAGRWRITEMDKWDEVDLLGSAHITFTGNDSGELVFLALEADLDVRYGTRDGAACAEFSWEGFGRWQPRQWSRLGRLVYRRPPRRPLHHSQRRRLRLHRRTRVTSSTACSHVRFQGFERDYSFRWVRAMPGR